MLLRGIAAASVVIAVLLMAFGSVDLIQAVLVFVGSFLGLLLLATAFLGVMCLAVDLRKPQEHDSKFYRRMMDVYIEALIRLVGIRLHTQGLEQTPREGRFLLVCNHLFVADPGILLHCFRNSQLAFVTKQENQKIPIVGKIMHKILCQNINRDNDREALKTILKCIQLIKDDEVSIGIFPEGYTSKDGFLHPFRPGAFKIAQKTKVPIVVCTIQGTRGLIPNMLHLRRTDVQLHLVEVIQPESYQGLSTVQLSDLVHEKMLADLGEVFRMPPSA